MAFKPIFNLTPELGENDTKFDRLFAPNEHFQIGHMKAQALHVPGHTPAEMAYLIGDAVFVGDTLFMPDVGTARCDFPGGELYQSIRRLLTLPSETRLLVCHDYPPSGREPTCITSVGTQKKEKIHVKEGVSEAEFVSIRMARDASLTVPTLFFPAIQVNIRAGNSPAAEAHGVSYLKTPVNQL